MVAPPTLGSVVRPSLAEVLLVFLGLMVLLVVAASRVALQPSRLVLRSRVTLAMATRDMTVAGVGIGRMALMRTAARMPRATRTATTPPATAGVPTGAFSSATEMGMNTKFDPGYQCRGCPFRNRSAKTVLDGPMSFQLLFAERADLVCGVAIACFNLMIALALVAIGLLLVVAVSSVAWFRDRSKELRQLPGTEAYRNVQRRPEAITFPGLSIWRVGGDLFFASIGHMRAALEASVAARPDVRRVLLGFDSVNFIDISARDELLSLIKKLQARGIAVAFVRVRDFVRDDMRRAGIEEILGPSNFHERITDGVRAWQRQKPEDVGLQ